MRIGRDGRRIRRRGRWLRVRRRRRGPGPGTARRDGLRRHLCARRHTAAIPQMRSLHLAPHEDEYPAGAPANSVTRSSPRAATEWLQALSHVRARCAGELEESAPRPTAVLAEQHRKAGRGPAAGAIAELIPDGQLPAKAFRGPRASGIDEALPLTPDDEPAGTQDLSLRLCTPPGFCIAHACLPGDASASQPRHRTCGLDHKEVPTLTT